MAAHEKYDILITGDLSQNEEYRLLSQNELRGIELLVAGHHGAATSTSDALLAQTGARTGILSVGAAVLGGIGSIPGAMIGGFAIGLLEALVAAVGLSVWKDAVVFAILIVVLLVKPSGIMGHPVTEKV